MRKELEKYSEYKEDNIEWIGKIPEHWNATKLKHLCVLQRGFDLPSQDRQEGQFPIYGGGGITGYHSKAMVQPPGVVTGRYGTVGEVFLVNEPFWPLNTSLYVKEFWSNLPEFVRYVLTTLPIETYSAKAAVPGINRNIIHQLPIAIPPLFEQKAIAHYLDTKTAQIDRKIDLLTQKATLYSNLKQSLINETVTRGLDKTAPMKDSGIEWIGEVPNHWKIKRVKELFEISRGRVIALTELVEDGHYPVYSSQTKDNGCLGYINTFDYEGEYVTWTTDGVNAGTVFMRRGQFNCTNICGTLKLKSKKQSITYFSYSLQVSTRHNKRIDTNGAKIMSNEMAFIQIVAASLSEQEAIADYLDTKTAQIDQIIQTINTQIEKLKELRKTLINDVVTGKIKIVDN